ncbi:MAG: 3-oxoacyl-ACP reductase [Acidimicrobiia bacterium]
MAGASGGVLDDRVVVVTGADQPVVRGIGEGLATAGAVVAPVDWDSIASRAAAEAAFADVVDGHGRVDGVLHAAIHPIAYERVAMADVDDARWDAVWEQTLRRAIFVLQAGFTHLRARGGAFVVVTPVLGMAGAAELAPCAAALEGVRVLAKSAARQWGEHGIRVNCLAPAPEHVPAGIGSDALALAPPALGGPGDPVTDLAPIVAWLLGPGAHFLTGATLSADGGVWMAP